MRDEPRSLQGAVSRYKVFHDFDPKKSGPFDARLSIPREMTLAGKALYTTYRSDKWHKGKTENYIHEHEAGVKVYVPGSRGPRVAVPKRVQGVEVLVLLGKCLGIAYADDSGEEMFGLDHSGAELYCTPDGKALLIITDKRKLEAIIWGGKLKVLEQGIVG